MASPLTRLFALLVTVALFVGICAILRSRGPRVVVLACLFVASLVSTQLSMKVLSNPPFNYKFPGLVTVLHFSCVSFVAYGYWLFWAREPWRCLPNSIGASRLLRSVVPIALSQPVSVIFNNKAMVFVGAGVVAIIGTLAPVTTALLSRMCGRTLSLLSWLGVLVAFSGGVVISWSEVTQVGSLSHEGQAAVTTGLLFAFLAVFGRSAKIVLMDTLLTPLAYSAGRVEEEPLSPMHLYALQFPLGTLLSLGYSLATENAVEAWRQLTPPIAGVVACSAANALALNFIGLHVLKEFGASAQQIIGKLNTICIAALSVAFLGEHLPILVLAGSCLVLSGVAIFERGTAGHGEADKDKESGSEGTSSSSSALEDSGDVQLVTWSRSEEGRKLVY